MLAKKLPFLFIGIAILLGFVVVSHATQRNVVTETADASPTPTVAASPLTVSSPSPSATPSAQTTNSTIPVIISIKYGGQKPDEQAPLQVTQNLSVLNALLQLKPTKVVVKEYSYGKLVDSIEGVTNGTDNRYWLYKVNGKEANMGAADYELQPNDQVLWEFKAYEQ